MSIVFMVQVALREVDASAPSERRRLIRLTVGVSAAAGSRLGYIGLALSTTWRRSRNLSTLLVSSITGGGPGNESYGMNMLVLRKFNDGTGRRS